MENNKKLYGYNMNKFLMGNITTGNSYTTAKSYYNLRFLNLLGETPYNIRIFVDALQRTNFCRTPNTLEMDVVCKSIINNTNLNLNANFVTLTKALNLLDLYVNKYESDFITTNFNYLVDAVNKILIRNYSKSLFRDSVDDGIYLINKHNEYFLNGFNTDLFHDVLGYDYSLHVDVANAINDIVDGQLSPQIAKLIESVFLTYNPLYNVDGTEETKDKYNLNSDFSVGSGKVNTEGGHGEYILNSTSDRDLETTNTFNNNLKGSTYDINGVVTAGAENKTTISGSVTTKNSESTMNDSDFYNTTQTVQTFGKKENSNDEYSTVEQGYNGQYTGTKTTTGRTDSDNTNINILRTKNTNNISDSTKTNTESPYSNVHILTRKGNIGVTKSTDLIDAERQTAIYNVAQEVAQLIAHEIFEGVY